jgi:hypothetical protein
MAPHNLKHRHHNDMVPCFHCSREVMRGMLHHRHATPGVATERQASEEIFRLLSGLGTPTTRDHDLAAQRPFRPTLVPLTPAIPPVPTALYHSSVTAVFISLPSESYSRSLQGRRTVLANGAIDGVRRRLIHGPRLLELHRPRRHFDDTPCGSGSGILRRCS